MPSLGFDFHFVLILSILSLKMVCSDVWNSDVRSPVTIVINTNGYIYVDTGRAILTKAVSEKPVRR